MKYWAAILLAVLANVTANISLKYFSKEIDFESESSVLIQSLSRPSLWIGLVSAALLLVFYVYALRGISLALAYAVVTGLALVCLTLASSPLFGLTITWSNYAGMILVVSGILLLST